MKFTFPPESRPLDGYTIKRAIHRGGFGEVYYALSDGGKEVALKLLQHETEVELRGVQQCLNLKHPNLVSIFDIRSDSDGDHWIVMEYVAGKDLADVVEEHPQGMPIEEVRRWLSGMVKGLAFLHDRGIVHRDLKPANVHLDQGVVKVGDVGLSKFISQSRRNEQTQSVGTVYYMAPEVAHGRYGKEVDVYSLGIVLYEMLTGRVPFDGETTGEILMKHLTERPDLEPLPPRLRPVVARALAKDPAQRTPTVEELEREFQLAVRGVELPRDIPEESFVGKRSAVSDQRSATVGRTASPSAGGRRSEVRDQRSGDVGRIANPSAARTATHGTSTPAEADPHATGPRRLGIALFVAIGLLMLLAAPLPVKRGVGFLLTCGILGGLAYAAWRGMGRSSASRVARAHQTAPTTSPSPLVGTAHPTPWLVRAMPPPKLTPETPRTIPWRQRFAELTASMTLAVPYALLVTAAIAVLTPQVFSIESDSPGGRIANPSEDVGQAFQPARAAAEPNSGQTRMSAPRTGSPSYGSLRAIDPGMVGLFALVTLFGAWGMLFAAKLREGRRVDGLARRVAQGTVGLLVGAAAFGFGNALLAQPAASGQSLEAAFHAFGAHSLADGTAPTLAGYLVFFGGLFAFRRWWRQADAFRPKRFRVGSLLLTVLVGLFLPLIFAFPQAWGVLWAAAISGVVQLAAPWMPPEERGRAMRT